MKCINKLYKYIGLMLVIILCMGLCGCGESQLPLEFKKGNTISASKLEGKATAFSTNLAVTAVDVAGKTGYVAEEESSAGLFDVNNAEVLYAYNIHNQMNPASLTKVLTAICALKYGNIDDVIVCSENINNLESGASTCGLKPGDTLTLNQALHFLLLPSANDAAIAIAEHISGSVEEFANLMNQEAVMLGATNSNFVNPHGLTAEGHYTTAYDMYLFANEAIRYGKFNEIIQLTDYTTSIKDSNGAEKEISVKTSNKFIDGTYQAPDNITVIGGKTGTTMAAGSCLLLINKDYKGNTYISVMLHASERSVLYENMIKLLTEIS